mmetsp:Transcript_105937/g.188413  ORF Transcript_105937/g.188413 Transcript_105937/m.188413 type:complete len:999 (+) Transcript_105937:5-3001(+)
MFGWLGGSAKEPASTMAEEMPPTKKMKGEDGEAIATGGEAEVDAEASSTAPAATPKAAGAVTASGAAMEVEPDGPKELEEDAKDDTRRKLEMPASFKVPDTTLNVMVSTTGNMLMMLNEGGFQHLYAGARANVGIRSGRYMYEVRVLELLNQAEGGLQIRTPSSKHMLRVGFSTAKCAPLMGDSEDSICFDSEGGLLFNKKRIVVPAKFGPECVIGVVLNLDADSANANTISLFKDGQRICDPQRLPEELKGKALFPTVTFKNMNLHANFGPCPYAPLPFKCKMVQEAALEDTEAVTYQLPADGKHQVVFPVCLPDEGTFDWLDMFLEKNPHFAELSERKVVDWAVRSGIFRPKINSSKASNDRLDVTFGMPHIDDGTVKQILQSVATAQQRDVVYMEVRGNLIEEDRKQALTKFRLPCYKKVAKVLMGEPADDFVQFMQDKLLKEKKAKAEVDAQSKRQERARQRLLEFQKKQVEWARKKAEREKKKAQPPAEGEEQKEDEAMEEEEPEPKMEAEPEEEPPKVELTEEERQQKFRKSELPDIAAQVLGSCFSSFTLPENEGFDEVEYCWQPPDACKKHLKTWVQERKITTRIDDLTPSEWFRERWAQWQKDLQSWHAKHMEWKDPAKRAALKSAKKTEDKEAKDEPMEKAEPATDAKEAKEEQKEEASAKDLTAEELEKLTVVQLKEKLKAASLPVSGNKADLIKRLLDNAKAPSKEEEKPSEQTEEEKKKAEAEAKEKEEKEEENIDYMKLLEQEIESSEMDVFDIQDVADTGEGEPLFSNFAFEDWAMLSLRYEIHLLTQAFLHDCGDPERVGIFPDHLLFYYNKYFKKGLNPKNYGVETTEDLMTLIKDTIVVLTGPKVVESQLMAELETNDIFIKLTEESRRDRQRRIDAGDDSAVLKFAGRPDQSSLKAAGSKAPAAVGPVPGKGAAKGGPATNVVLQQQQRQQQLRQQMQQMAQNVAPKMPPWMPGGGMFGKGGTAVPLAQQRLMARMQGW